MLIKKILVPTDLSDLSRSAVEAAISLAKKINANVMLLHVTKRGGTESAMAELQTFSERFQKEKRLTALEVCEGKPFSEIVAAAKKMQADLITIGSHGRTGLASMLIGSEAERVVRTAHCPVMTIKPHTWKTSASKAVLNIRRILFPTDFSENSYAALDYALFLAKKYQAKIYLLHVINKLFFYDSYLLSHFPVDQIETQAKRGSFEKMTALVESRIAGEVPVETMFRFGIPFSEIKTAARQCSVDLIVLATHGSTDTSEMLIGSVAEKTVRHADRLVLTVKPQSFQRNQASLSTIHH